MNIDKYREAANILENHYIKINLSRNKHSKIHSDKVKNECNNV